MDEEENNLIYFKRWADGLAVVCFFIWEIGVFAGDVLFLQEYGRSF